jgi:translation initiation factor 2 beta subunit (eIF-2beta)/eIF-5
MSAISKNKSTLLFISEEKINQIFNDKTELINSLLSISTKLSQDFFINAKDKKIIKFLLKYFKRSGKLNDIKAILRHKKICKGLIYVKKINQYQEKIKTFLTKFFLILIFNSSELKPFFCYNKDNIIKKIFHLMRIYYLHNL